MKLKHGTKEEHLATLRRAKDGGLKSVWSGDIRRNPYLVENLKFGVKEKIIKTEWYDDDYNQESGWEIKFLKEKF